MKLGLVAILVVGCESTHAPEPAKPAVAPPAASGIDANFADTIRKAAVAYKQWGRVDELPRQAPADCAWVGGNPEGQASQVRLSRAKDAPHGTKLYYLWASDRAAYLENRATAVGFAIVKESFHAVPATANAQAKATPGDYTRAPSPIRTLVVEGKSVETGGSAGLFVMAKVAGDDQTDAGWIYGTAKLDGTVTSAGRVTTCMGCHADATHERLFGLN